MQWQQKKQNKRWRWPRKRWRCHIKSGGWKEIKSDFKSMQALADTLSALCLHGHLEGNNVMLQVPNNHYHGSHTHTHTSIFYVMIWCWWLSIKKNYFKFSTASSPYIPKIMIFLLKFVLDTYESGVSLPYYIKISLFSSIFFFCASFICAFEIVLSFCFVLFSFTVIVCCMIIAIGYSCNELYLPYRVLVA